MANHTELGRRVMEVVIRSPGCDLEEIVRECGDVTWNQVFFEVDRLSREGQVILHIKQRGHYSVKPVQPAIRQS
jgi:hypothetical protein